MIKKIQQLLTIGTHPGLTLNEEKLVKLLNFICVTWYCVILLFLVTDYFFRPEFLSFLLLNLSNAGVISLILYLHHKQKYFAARIILIAQLFLSTLVFSLVAKAGTLLELYLILVPIFAVIFLRRKTIQYIILLVVLVAIAWLFTVQESMNGLGDHLPSLFIIIFVTFIFFRYIKEITTENESRLIEQKNKIRELYEHQNRFFNNIAHEIRTPLTIINGGIAKLNRSDTVPAGGNTLKTMAAQTKNIQDIVRDVLDLTKMDSNKFSLNKKNVNISELVYRIYFAFSSNFEMKNIDYKFLDVTPKNAYIWADETYLTRAIGNLFTNALKYTDDHKKVAIILEQEGAEFIIKVSDLGIGISDADIDRIFTRFYQTNNHINRAGGSGIGLSFTREIVELHQGEISVTSTAGAGSTFMITLPINNFAEHADTPAETNITKKEPVPDTEGVLLKNVGIMQHTNPPKDAPHILLVEDHDDMRAYLRSLLGQYVITETQNGLEALDYLTENKVDFVITDYMMPKMDGNELVQTIQDKGIDVPILMLTARADVSVKLDMLRLGIDDYMTKPFEEEELLIRIRKGLKNFGSRKEFIEEERIPPAELKAAKFIQDLKTHIEENCTNADFSVPNVCDKFALSQSSMYRKVKSLTGLSTKLFITEVRLQKARQIAEENPSFSAKEVGYEVGFSNYTHLRKLYLKRFGKTLLD